jgi:HJR/Mrr/RecB family endonuclease
MDPIEFEHFIGDQFKKRGYRVSVTKATGDQGIDLICYKDGKKVIVQCKKYHNQVPSQAVMNLIGAKHFHDAHEAILITTGQFTNAGKAYANKTNIQLIDGKQLIEWLKQ